MTNNTQNTSESWQNDEKFQQELKQFQLIPLIIIIVIGFLANFSVLVNGIYKRKEIKHFSNYFVLSMAFADLWVIFTIPFHLYEYLEGYYGVHDYFCTYVIPLRETFQGVIMLSISTLAIMRVRQVSAYPLKQFSKRTCLILVFCIWIFSFLLCTVPFYRGVYYFNDDGTCDPVYKDENELKIHVTAIVCLIMSPMLIATIAYLTVIKTIVCVHGNDLENEQLVRRNRRITILLIALILSCWISFLPLSLYHLKEIYGSHHDSLIPWHIGTVLFLGGSALNPVLVLITMPEYRFFSNIECRFFRKARIADEFNVMKKNVIISSSV